MKRIAFVALISVLMTAFGLAQLDAVKTLRGTVLDGERTEPLVGANVFLQGTVYGTTTDTQGRFFLNNIPEGQYTLSVSMIGYKRRTQQIAIERGTELAITIRLEQAPIQNAPVIVTASRREQDFDEVPVSVSVVDGGQIASRNPVAVDEILRYVPGVNITNSQVNVRGSTGYSYGVGTRVLLLVDGEPLLTGDTGEIIWEAIPTVNIDRVEVMKGAGSALYGSNALGGVINIVTQRPGDKPETRFRLYGGTYENPAYDEWRWTNDARRFSGLTAAHQERIGSWSVGFGGSRTLDDGYKRNDYWKRWNAWSRIGYDLSAFQSVDVSFSMLDQRRGNFLYWKDVNHALEPNDDQLSQTVQSFRWSLGAGYKRIISNAMSAVARVTWFRSRWENNISSSFAPSGDNSRSGALVNDVQLNFEPSPGNILTAGITGTFNTVDADTIFGNHSSADGAFYIQDELHIAADARVTLGGRFDYQRTDGLDPFSQFNPKIGLAYAPMATTRLRVSVGRGFRAPSIAEAYTTTQVGALVILPNTALQPERSLSFEIGGMQTIAEDLTADLALFRNEFWDLIEPSFAPDGFVHFQNITRARVTGAELSLRLNALHGIVPAEISYTYVYPQNLTTDDILKYRPRHLVYLSLQGILHPLTLGVDFRFLSKTERIDDELVLSGTVPEGDRRVPIYLTDIRATADWRFAGVPITSTFQIKNLFQYYYTDFIGNLGATRNFILTLESELP